MIAVIYGTTGELIKLAPVLTRLAGQTRVLTLCTGQQVEQIPQMLTDFHLQEPDLWLARGAGGRDLQRSADIPGWGRRVAGTFLQNRRRLQSAVRDDGHRPLVLVHGDTFTTVLGAVIGRMLGTDVAHVEAGLRSGSWRNPFPEELDRRITSRLATIHLAPGAWAANNLRAAGVSGQIVDTGDNTIRDALDLVPPQAPEVDLPSEEFGVVSLHRFELLGQPKEFRAALEVLRDASRSTPLVFIDHPVTAAAISSEGLEGLFDDQHFVRVPRQRYFPFIALLKASAFLVTDSGGSQEECAALGHPCLVHRATTERQDGLEGPVVLSRMNLSVLSSFLEDPQRHRRQPVSTRGRPSDTILETLRSGDFL